MAYTIALVASTGFLLWAIYKTIAIIRSPLNAIPNAHFTAPVSRLWLLWTKATGKEFSACLEAHRQLGPVIRIGPNELSINCIKDGVQTVYGGNWDKSSMYDVFKYFGHSPLFGICQGAAHAKRKRAFAQMYSKSTIDTSVELREILTAIGRDTLQPRLRELARNGTNAEAFSLTREYAFDAVTAYIYGPENSTSFLNDPAKVSQYISAFQAVFEQWSFFMTTEFSRFVDLAQWVGISLIPSSFLSSLQTIESFGLELTTTAIGTLRATASDQSTSRSFRQMWQKLDYVPEDQKAQVITSDIADQILAGHEAPGITLTYLMWQLSKHPETQDRLRDELNSLASAGQPPERSQVLDDILTETLRLYPASGGPFPRVAPEGAKLAGFAIPAETIVTASPHVLGRNPEVFPDPESWLPERWEKVTLEERKRMKQWAWYFGSGSRVCIGEHLAILTMKQFIVEVYSTYRTTIAAKSNMSQLQTFMSVPADKSLYLNFEAV